MEAFRREEWIGSSQGGGVARGQPSMLAIQSQTRPVSSVSHPPLSHLARRRTAVRIVLIALLISLGAVRGSAQESDADYARHVFHELLDLRTGFDTEWDFGAEAEGRTTGGGTNGGPLSSTSESFFLSRAALARTDLALGVGFEEAEFRLSRPQGLPLPATLSSLGLPLDLRWRVQPDIACVTEWVPCFNSESFGTGSNALELAGSVTFLWMFNERLLIAVGAEFDALGEYPVLPLGGAVFALSDTWEARLLFPDPRLAWHASPHIEISLGVHYEYDSYRVDGGLGSAAGKPRLNGAVLSLESTLYGPAFRWRFGRVGSIELLGGVAADRRYSYYRVGYSVDVRPAAAFRLSAEVGF
jgi:hypothetical protein